MGFEILHAHGEESIRWLSLIDRLIPEQRDIHFLPQYGQIYQKTYGFEPFLAVFTDERGFVIQPFVKRPLNDLPFLRDQNISHPYYDIANPYGYGGPICSCNDTGLVTQLLQEFENNLIDYCMQEELASEFTSLHPLLKNHKWFEELRFVSVDQQKSIVYFDLTLTEEELWRGMNRGHRSGINKARKNGVSIAQVELTPENLTLFNKLYYQTMERNLAADRWFFPSDYFYNCYKYLGSERVSLFFAYVDGTVASAYFLMHDFATAYYHFGGSDSRFYDLRPNNLLMYETALWAKRQGYLQYHLGGGVAASPEDNLFRFKSGFSSKTATLYTYHRVLHHQTYESLCRIKEQYELQARGMVCESDYFPLYRR